MLIRDVMTREVVTASPDTELADLIDLLIDRNVTGVPVVDADGAVIGVVTEADIVARQAYPNSRRPRLSALRDLLHGHRNPWWQKAAATTIGDVMTSPAHTIFETEPLHNAASKMLTLGCKRLVVLDNAGRLAGIVSRRDLLRSFHRTDEVIAADVEAALADPLRCPEAHGVTLTCVASGVVFLSGWTRTDLDAELVDAIVRGLPGVLDVRGCLGRRATHRGPLDVRITQVTSATEATSNI